MRVVVVEDEIRIREGIQGLLEMMGQDYELAGSAENGRLGEVGETYSSYLKNYRVNKAKELLVGTQMKQYEVARQVGYTDSKYFSKVFRELTGYFPAEYRKVYK